MDPPRSSVDPPLQPSDPQSKERNLSLWEAARDGDFEKAKVAIDAGAHVDWKCNRECKAAPVFYKARPFSSCTALHAACAVSGTKEQGDASKIVELLLANGASETAFAHVEDKEHGDRDLQPIHIAAGIGNLRTLQHLLAKVKPNAACLKEGKPYYYPIHDAAWFDRPECVSELIKNGADIKQATSEGNTVLHFAAQNGSTKLAELIKDEIGPDGMRELVKAKNDRKQTAVDCAVQCGQFPLQRLGDLFWDYMEGTAQVDTFMGVAKQCPQKVPDLFRGVNEAQRIGNRHGTCHRNRQSQHGAGVVPVASDPRPQKRLPNVREADDMQDAHNAIVTDVAVQSPSAARNAEDSAEQDKSREADGVGSENISEKWKDWRKAAIKNKKITVDRFAELLDSAPYAVSHVLDTATTKPEVGYRPLHPLPLCADLPLVIGTIHMTTEYQLDCEWNYDRDIPDPHYPPWHDTFTRCKKDKRNEQEVNIRVVLLQGLLDCDFVHALATTGTHNEFIHYKPVVHAMLEYIWLKFRWLFFLDLAHESAATFVISVWVWGDSAAWPQLVPDLLWCVVASRSLLESAHLWWSIVSCIAELDLRGLRRWLTWSWFRVVMIISSMALVINVRKGTGAHQGAYYVHPDTDSSLRILLAWNVLFHWLDLLCQLTSFYKTGSRLLPIMNSIAPLSTMLTIMFFICFAFAHAFWALHVVKVDMVSLYAMVNHLMTGDVVWDYGELRAMGTATQYVVMLLSVLGLVLFLITAINVFIAVLSDCYDREKERLTCTFSKVRAQICAKYFLRPQFGWLPKVEVEVEMRTYPWVAHRDQSGDPDKSQERSPEDTPFRHGACVAVRLLCRACCVLPIVPVAAVAPLQPTVVSAVMTACLFALHGTLKTVFTSGWPKKYLWFCCDTEYEENKFLSPKERLSPDEDLGRIGILKKLIRGQNPETRLQACIH